MMTNAPITSEAILVKVSYLWTTLLHSLICVQLAKATLILKRMEYNIGPRELSSVGWTMHKNMQGPGFKPRPPPKKIK